MCIRIRAREDGNLVTIKKGGGKMNCKQKKYNDGDYTVCEKCERAKTCRRAERCASCGRTDGVFYDAHSDLFLCGRCFGEIDA